MTYRDITLGILAGGKSTRMGSDKALLVWRGQALAEHLAKSLAGCGSVLVSTASAEQLAGLPYPIVADERQDYGPLEGIYRLLLAAQTDWVFVVATDLPLVNSDLLACLLKQLAVDGQREADAERAANGHLEDDAGHAADRHREDGTEISAVIPCTDDRVHPLCGLYHRCALPRLEALFARGEHRVRALLDELETVYVPIAAYGVDPRVLTNVNTPEEFRRLSDF